MHLSAVYDMPWLLYHALAFALFKTYGVVSVDYFPMNNGNSRKTRPSVVLSPLSQSFLLQLKN